MQIHKVIAIALFTLVSSLNALPADIDIEFRKAITNDDTTGLDILFAKYNDIFRNDDYYQLAYFVIQRNRSLACLKKIYDACKDKNNFFRPNDNCPYAKYLKQRSLMYHAAQHKRADVITFLLYDNQSMHDIPSLLNTMQRVKKFTTKHIRNLLQRKKKMTKSIHQKHRSRR